MQTFFTIFGIVTFTYYLVRLLVRIDTGKRW